MKRIISITIIAATISGIAYGSYFKNGWIVASPNTFTPKANIHADQGSGTEVYTKYTQDGSTGQQSTDGLDVGYDSATVARLWNHENTGMALATNDIQRLTILANGNVGIGSTVPANALDVNGNISATTVYAALSGNATTATSLAANPTDCGASSFATAIDAQGNLTCSIPAGTTYSIGTIDSQTKSADGAVISGSSIVMQTEDATHPGLVSNGTQTISGAKTFSSTVTGSITGNSGTATALAANPADCSANNYATTIAANGDLTCSTVTDSGLATSYIKADGTRGLSANWDAGAHTITATTFIGALTGTASGNPPNARLINTTAPIAGGGDLSADRTITCNVASGSQAGCLASADWTTFNGKQAAGNYITALTGDVTASGPGSVAATLATVNSNVGSFGSSTAIPSITVNGKGLVTAASTNVVIAPAGTLTGTTLASNVVTSSLTTVGTIGTGVWNGTVVDVAHGGTGAATETAHGVLLGQGTSAVTATSAGATNTVLHGNTGADPTYSDIVNADIDSAAAIADTKLATISTASKVSNSATTATASNTASTIVLRDASKNFIAGTITAALSGNASTATALAANPSDCSASNYATAIDASGNLTCGQVSLTAGVSGTLPYANGGTNAATSWTQGSIMFAGASAFAQDNSNFFWDATNHRLGLGVTAPNYLIQQDKGTATATYHQFTANATTGQLSTDGTLIGIDASGDTVFNQQEALPMIFDVNGTEAMRIDSSQNLAIGINATANSAPLRVRKTFTDPSATTYGAQIDPGFVATSSNANIIAGLDLAPSITAASTSNWTNASGFEALRIVPQTVAGATGTITNMFGALQAFVNGGDTTITNYYADKISNPTNTGAGSIGSAAGLNVIDLTTATNNSDILIASISIPTGNFGIYNNSAYNNYFASNTGFGATDPGSPITAAAAGVTVGTNEQIALRSQRAAIVSGNMIGGIYYRSNDTNLTAPGTIVALDDAVAEANHTGSDLTTGFAWQTTSVLTMAERMRLTGAGKLGIGISSPTNLVHQDGGTGVATYHQFTANTTTGQTATDGFLLGIDSSGDGIINQQEALPIIIETSGTEAMRIDSSHNIGIGTTSTSSALLTIKGAGSNTATQMLNVDPLNTTRFTRTNGGASTQYMDTASSNIIYTNDTIGLDTPVATGSTTSQQNSVTWNHTVGTQNNRILVVGVALHNTNGNDTVQSVTYGAANLTRLDVISRANAAEEVWYLLNPTSGTAAITVTDTGVQTDRMVGGSVSYYNVNQTTPFETSARTSGASTTSSGSLSVTSAIGDLVLDFLSKQNTGDAVSVNSGQTSRWNVSSTAGGDANASRQIGAGSTLTAADQTTSVSWSWSAGATRAFAYIGAALRPTYTAAVTTTPTGHIEFSGTAPSVASGATDCGTSPSISGNDNAGIVTVGSGVNGGKCTLTFANAWTNHAICNVSDETTGNLVRPVATTTTMAITGTLVAGDTLVYSCRGYK
jgi:hypothetical protein